jgi:hypothetical protein
MREYATSDNRCIHAKRVWEKQQKQKRQQQSHQLRTEEPNSISVEQARARTKLAELSLPS